MSAQFDALELPRERIAQWLWCFTATGAGLRLLAYLLRTPIWTDEAKLATSLLDRGYAGLLEPYAFGQIAPFAFMWIQKSSTLLFGFSEYSLRLFPVLAAVAGVLLMHRLARKLLDGPALLFAVGIFAVSYYPVRHAAELKPYASDLFASLVITLLAVTWLRDPARGRPLWWLALAAPLLVLLSYPAIFVACGVLAALFVPVWKRRRAGSSLWAWAACGVSAVGAFAANYLLVAARHAGSRSATAPWVDGFPSWNDPLGALTWVARAHTGRTFGYPIGGDGGGSLLTFAAFVAGAVVLWRSRRRPLLLVLLAPFAFGFAAGALHLYPYGGSGRVSQYLVPAICLLAGVGAARLTVLARRPANRRRAQIGVLAFLVLFGAALGTSAVLRPYRDPPDRVARDFARWFWDTKSRDAVLVSAWEDLRLDFAAPDTRAWLPGGAGYRVNMRIYHSGAGPADLERVSPTRPLRVAFQGSRVRENAEAFEDWLDRMQDDHRLVGREVHRLGPFREQHGREDWLELVSFVPRERETIAE